MKRSAGSCGKSAGALSPIQYEDPGRAIMTNDGIRQLELLLREVVKLLNEPNPSNKRVAVHKLERVSSLAATLAATVRAHR
jgi:hypothetical protein